MFLQKVKVKRFADSKKIYGDEYRYGGRKLITYPNEKLEDAYFVIGVTAIKEGVTEYDREYGHTFAQTKSHKVYLVAKSIGRRFKVLEEDLEFVK